MSKASRSSTNHNKWVTIVVLLILLLVTFFHHDDLGTSTRGTTVDPKFARAANHNNRSVPEQQQQENENAFRVDSTLAAKAQRFVQERKQVYEDLGIGFNWHLRGLAYASEHLQLVVAGQVELDTAAVAPARGRIVFANVHPFAMTKTAEAEAATQPWRNDCDQLNFWVRLHGPEIYAGQAVAVPADPTRQQHCYWTYEFHLTVPGNYTLDSKLVLWNGDAHGDGRDVCERQRGDVPAEIREKYPVHFGLRGFKLYAPEENCCQICARQRHPPCRYWATPAEKIVEPSFFANGCELFFSREDIRGPDDVPFKSAILGDLVNYSFSGFNIAKGLRNWDPPVWQSSRRRLAQKLSSSAASALSHFRNKTLLTTRRQGREQGRRRRLNRGFKRFHGAPHNQSTTMYLGCGWHQFYTLEVPCVSGDLDDRVVLSQDWLVIEAPPASSTPVAVEPLSPLPLCTQRDEQMDHVRGRWVKEPWPNNTVCPLPYRESPDFSKDFPITDHDPARPHCWHRDNTAVMGYRCAEPNCRMIWPASRWESSLRMKQFNAVWRNEACDYYEFTNEELQTCLTKRKIAEFRKVGQSVADQLNNALSLRLVGLELYNAAASDSVTVTFGTLGILHRSIASTAENREKLAGLEPVDPNREIKLVVNGYYLTSERETHCHAGYMRRMNYMFEEILIPKNYTVLDAYHVSQGLVYDTAGQFDGMHLMGPVLKISVNKIFHYLCKDVVEGSRM